MNDELEGRLSNHKFESALNYLDGETREVKILVKALSATYGNTGWVLGYTGIIINNALENIGVKFDDD